MKQEWYTASGIEAKMHETIRTLQNLMVLESCSGPIGLLGSFHLLMESSMFLSLWVLVGCIPVTRFHS